MHGSDAVAVDARSRAAGPRDGGPFSAGSRGPAEPLPPVARLDALRAGDRSAADRLLPVVYDELHALAERFLRRERPDHTLQPTALVHEAYLRLIGPRAPQCENCEHLIGVAARAMRQILINHALARRAVKRGGNGRRLPLDEVLGLYEQHSLDLLAMDEALSRLARRDKRQARIVELRFFAGLSVQEIATVLDLPLRTVEREWSMARAWLCRQMTE